MVKPFLIGLMFLVLGGCNSTRDITPMRLKAVQVEDLVDRPSRELMRVSPPKQMMVKGAPDADNAEVAAKNNLRALKIESNNALLQQYVCNLFKDSVGEVCVKNK